jgi:hypothetical protein
MWDFGPDPFKRANYGDVLKMQRQGSSTNKKFWDFSDMQRTKAKTPRFRCEYPLCPEHGERTGHSYEDGDNCGYILILSTVVMDAENKDTLYYTWVYMPEGKAGNSAMYMQEAENRCHRVVRNGAMCSLETARLKLKTEYDPYYYDIVEGIPAKLFKTREEYQGQEY